LSIAVEMLSKPALLILDEPTSPLDPETIREFLSYLKKIQEEGTTIIMVTHKTEDIQYADFFMVPGKRGEIMLPRTTRGYNFYFS
jgi:ABC-type multidrug transport system ATPase subunit